MATVVDQQQPIFKHYCRICKKGFGCGRALGGHMRAHGIGEENGNMDEDEDEDVGSDWEEKVGGHPPPGNKRMYALRTNTNRLKSCRTCENCGKEFSSWKSFLEHGKCSSVDAESLVSSKGSDDEDMDVEDGMAPRGYGWSKGKRTRRAIINSKLGNSSSVCPSTEEEDFAANCLMMLSNAGNARVVDPLGLVAETEESCASASREEEERRKPVTGLTYATPVTTNILSNFIDHNKATGKGIANTNTNSKGMFECKACKKVFNSHQALGGHRASHKKVKGCFASKLDDNLDESVILEEDVITNEEFSIPTKSTSQPVLTLDHHPHHHQPSSSYKKKSKVHECSICHRIFSSGQALGGHKRCHWLTSSNSTDTSSIINKFHPHQHQFHQDPTTQIHHNHLHQTVPTNNFNLSAEPTLDLNLPAPVDDHNTTGVRHEGRARLSFEMPTEIYLQPWLSSTSTATTIVQTKEMNNDQQNNNNKNNNNKNNNHKNSSSSGLLLNDQQDIDHDPGEANTNNNYNNNKVKLAKLSELKDMNMGGGGSFTWLQVGIGSSTSNNVGSTN